jgi:hypothetical protein
VAVVMTLTTAVVVAIVLATSVMSMVSVIAL